MKNYILIRGLTREACHWYDLPERFENAHSDVKVFCLDLPGAGKFFKDKFPLSTDALLIEIYNEIKKIKAENDGSFHVMTISLGGMIVMLLQEKYPDLFESSIIINSSARDISPVHHRMQIKALKSVIKTPFIKDIKKRELNILEFTSNLRTQNELEKIASFYAKEHSLRPMKIENALRQLVWAAQAKSPHSLPGRVLFVASKADKLAHYSCSEKLADKFKKDLVLHSEAGHDLPLDCGDWLIEQISTFDNLN